MKKGLKIYLIVLSFFVLMTIVASSGVAGGDPEEAKFALFGFIVWSLIIYFVRKAILKSSKRKKEILLAQQQQLNFLTERKITANVALKHMVGLPIAEGVECLIYSYPDKISFTGSGMEFNLDKSKLTDVCVKTNLEIQNQYVSSIGGAVGGAILFGGLGAMVGGRAKVKEVRTTSYYLIFTYLNGEDLKYVSFDVSNQTKQANQFVEEFKAMPKTNTVVEL